MRLAAKGAARLMAADDGPRIAALAFDGWDTHANEGGPVGRLAQLLSGLDGALARMTHPTDFGAYLDMVLDFVAFTAIAEIAGPFWSGRALGMQNTSQLFTTGVVPPAFGALITAAGFPVAFAVCALFPLVALPLVPVHADPLRPRH